jgi:hypothetical protein
MTALILDVPNPSVMNRPGAEIGESHKYESETSCWSKSFMASDPEIDTMLDT